MNYNYPNDGKLHIRYHDLLKCTPGQIENLVLEKFGLKQPFSSDSTQFGTDRHEMFELEMKETKRLPEAFLNECKQLPTHYKDIEIDAVEQEIATEIFEGIVLHSRPDAVSTSYGLIADPKVTIQGIKKWNPSRQLLMYAYHFIVRGIKIKEIVYLGEIWDYTEVPNNGKIKKVPKDIIDYQCLIKNIDEQEVKTMVHEWARPRIEYLKAAVELYKEGKL